ncbi:hypothetical protein C8R45DRAFT_989260 [Mycena sanguinolenta]|nr:hypothetical protein C8R45DRAFT_989260 [Mycena sanguinolenta]
MDLVLCIGILGHIPYHLQHSLPFVSFFFSHNIVHYPKMHYFGVVNSGILWLGFCASVMCPGLSLTPAMRPVYRHMP